MAVRCFVYSGLVAVRTHGCAGRDELEHFLAPYVLLHPELHPDDAVRAEVVGFRHHARHRQLPGVVHRLGQHLELLVLAPLSALNPDVVNRRADDESERLEARLADQHVLRDREVGGEHPARGRSRSRCEAAVRRLRFPRCSAGVGIRPSEERHLSSLGARELCPNERRGPYLTLRTRSLDADDPTGR